MNEPVSQRRRHLVIAGIAGALTPAGVLAGTGGCTAYDVVLILKRSRQEVSSCELKLSAERAPTDPKVFTKIHMHFIVRGRDLKPSMVENAVRLSRDKYCSASKMLEKTAVITADFEIVDA